MARAERQDQPRIQCNLRAELYILFPEETFRPHPYMVTIRDASAQGLRVQCITLSRNQLEMIESSVRFARLVLRGDNQTSKIYCRIVWASYSERGDGRIEADLGMSYDVRSEEDNGAIDHLLQRARTASDTLVEED